MPKYKVELEQYAQEVADVEIEADTPAEAALLAVDEDADWYDGDHAIKRSAVAVYDEHGKLVWKPVETFP